MKELFIVFVLFALALFGAYSLVKTIVFKIYHFIILLRKESDINAQSSCSSADSDYVDNASGSS